MAVPTNYGEAMALLTAALPNDPVSAADERDVATWLHNRLLVVEGLIPSYPLAVPGATPNPLPTSPRNIVIDGQSNAVAQTTGTSGTSFLTQYISSRLLAWSFVAQAFVQLQDAGGNMKNPIGVGPLGAGGPGAGQIVTPLLDAIAGRLPVGQRVYTWALAYSGQGIDYFRSNSATLAWFNTAPATQHPTLNHFDLLNQEIEASGRTPDLYIFVQGEADWGTAQAVYYAKIRELFAELTLLYPGMHFIIVKTHHTTNPANGVALAQQQLADENPHIHAIDCSDMAAYSAWWGGLAGQHYTNAGYKEVFRRIDALLLGLPARPAVAPAAHIDDVITWHHRWGEIFYTTGVASHNLAVWSDSSQLGPSGNQSLGADGVYSRTAPTAVSYDPAFGGVACADFDGVADGMREPAIGESSDTWTVFFVAVCDDATVGPPNQYAISAFSGSGRWHIGFPSATGAEDWYVSDASTTHLDVAPYTGADNIAHSYAFTWSPTVTRVYKDGVLTFTGGGIPNADPSTPDIGVGHLLGTGSFDGRIATISLAAGHLLTDAEAAACHAWAEVTCLP